MGSVVSDIFGKNSSPPPAPDYAGAATAQGAANKDAAIASAMLSNPNIYGPYGSQTVSYSEGPNGNFIPTVRQTLDPSQQGLLDQQNALKLGLAGLGTSALGRVGGVMSTPFQFNGPGVQTSLGPNYTTNAGQNGALDLSGVAKMPVNAGTTGFDALMSRIQPQLDRTQTSLNTQLTNQGLRPGDEAWANAQKDFAYQANDARTQAANYGIGLDMNANNQGYQQALSSGNFANNANLANANFANNAELQQAQFGNQAQQQALQQALYQRQMPINELTALMSGSQVSTPQFQQYSGQTITPGNIAGATQQAGQYAGNVYSNQMAQNNAMMGGLAQLGNAGLMAGAMGGGGTAAGIAGLGAMFSDRRLKSNVERIGTHPVGVPLYEYDIFGRRERGVMADELQAVRPDAVLTHPSGYLMVDYSAISGTR